MCSLNGPQGEYFVTIRRSPDHQMAEAQEDRERATIFGRALDGGPAVRWATRDQTPRPTSRPISLSLLAGGRPRTSGRVWWVS
jgi:hypothetical protein